MTTRHSAILGGDGFKLKNPTQEEKHGIGIRHLMSSLGFLAAAVTYSQRFCLSLAITAMTTGHHLDKVDPDACPGNMNETKEREGEFHWDEEAQGLVLASFFYGYAVTPLLGGWLGEQYGAKHVMGCGMLISTIGTYLTPIVAREGGWKAYMAIRIFMGFGQGPIYPMLSLILAEWAPAVERGQMGAMMFAGAQMGNVLSMFVTGYTISWLGWPAGFYCWGVFGTVWLILWYSIFTNSPAQHPWISEKEKTYILDFRGRAADAPPITLKVFKSMATNLPLWALVIAQVGHDWGLFTIIVDLPKYFKNVLKLSLKTNAAVSAAPYLVMWVFAIISGFVSDWMVGPKQFDVTFVRKLFITVANIGPAIGIMSAVYSGCNKILACLFFIFGMGTMGAFIPSLKVNPVDLSPNFAGITMAIVNGLGSLSGIATPYLVGLMAPNSFRKEWEAVFWVTTAVLFITSVIYIIWGSAKAQPFDNKAD